jgi:molybdenum cofactor biosynthesis enzyme MoaA
MEQNDMKYMIHYPIFLDCNLKCEYCFHRDEFKNGNLGGPNFTVDQYKLWRDKFIKDGEILINFHGAEPFTSLNIQLITNVLDNTTERFELLTNGLENQNNFERILKYKNRIDRIGFTYHRKKIENIEKFNKIYVENISFLQKAGIPVYVKELLIPEYESKIRNSIELWKQLNIEVKIQDFRGYDKGRDFTELKRYTPEQFALINQEYRKDELVCYCRQGYKNIIIRGGWQAGDILACWEDPTVIGNIIDMTYNSDYEIIKDFENNRIDVRGVPKIYKGTYERDLYVPN